MSAPHEDDAESSSTRSREKPTTGTTGPSRSSVASSPIAKRVLLLTDAYWHPHGGTEGQILALVGNLPASWRAEMWVAHHSPWLDENAFPCPTRSLNLGSLKNPWTWWRIRGLANEVRNGGFSLVHTFMGDSSVLGPVLARRAGIPVLVSRRDLGFWQTRGKVWALRRVRRFVSGYLANADAVKRHVVTTERVAADDVAVVHNGLSLDAFQRPATPGSLAAIGVPTDAVVLVSIANLKPLKRQRDLVLAAGRLLARHPRLHVLLLGQGEDDDVRRAEREAGMAGRVTIHHAQGGAADLAKSAAVSVLCSETEGLSNAILESMACGLPVVATAVGGNPDLVQDGINGFLYPAGDVSALASRLDTLLSDPAMRSRMGAASRAQLRERFGLGRMVAETVEVWERVLAGRRVGEQGEGAGMSSSRSAAAST